MKSVDKFWDENCEKYNDLESLWWGYNKDEGIVVVDTSVRGNSIQYFGKTLFLRCSDLSLFVECWPCPDFHGENSSYFGTLPTKLRNGIKDEIENFKNLWRDYKSIINSHVSDGKDFIVAQTLQQSRAYLFEVNRQRFFHKLGISVPRVRSSGSNKPRQTRCYNCKKAINNEMNAECCSCGWIVCFCGACGCGYGAL